MTEYLLGLVICSVTAAVICHICPSESLSGHQKFIAGLCIVCVGITPAAEVIEFIREFDIRLYIFDEGQDKYGDMWQEYLEDYGEEAVREYVSVHLRDSFGVEAKKITVSYKETDGEVAIKRIYIELPQSAVFKDTAKIEVYFEKIFDCEVVTAIT